MSKWFCVDQMDLDFISYSDSISQTGDFFSSLPLHISGKTVIFPDICFHHPCFMNMVTFNLLWPLSVAALLVGWCFVSPAPEAWQA